MKQEGSMRFENRDFVFNETTKKCKLEFTATFLDMEADDKALIMLAIDAIAGLIEENNADPEIIFKEVLKLRNRH
jgi:hypothetical protein